MLQEAEYLFTQPLDDNLLDVSKPHLAFMNSWSRAVHTLLGFAGQFRRPPDQVGQGRDVAGHVFVPIEVQ